MAGQFDVVWIDFGVESTCEPNPNYPNGVDADLSAGRINCTVHVPYPAKRCGSYNIHCNWCHLNAIITTAGRPDDPKSIKLPCRPVSTGGQVQ